MPPGSTGTVTLPLGDWGRAVTESGAAVWTDGAFVPGADGVVSGMALGTDAVTFEVGSGTYTFIVA